jgi:hypothetical protein
VSEIEQKLVELRDDHLALAGKIKCLQAISNLYYDLRHWLGDNVMSLEEISKIEETHVSVSKDKLNKPVDYHQTTVILSLLSCEHSRLRELVRERKYKSM